MSQEPLFYVFLAFLPAVGSPFSTRRHQVPVRSLRWHLGEKADVVEAKLEHVGVL